jgi:anti-anti-sigma regulatory factor
VPQSLVLPWLEAAGGTGQRLTGQRPPACLSESVQIPFKPPYGSYGVHSRGSGGIVTIAVACSATRSDMHLTPGDALKIEQSTHNDYVLQFLHGELNSATASLVRQMLETQLAGQPPAIICDLAGVTAINPEGAAVFASIRHPALGWPGTALVLCGARPAVKAVLTRLQVQHHLPVCDTLGQAVQHALHHPPPLREQLDLGPTPAAADQARAFTAETCTRWKLDQMTGIADVLVNELVTNAVMHAKTPLTVRLELFGELSIAVHDQSPVRPCPLPRRPGQHQHGLELLASLAKAWGCQQEPDGKVVWCALDVL